MSTSTNAPARVFRLPDLGEGLTEAEVVRWLVAVGDQVAVDQAIVEVETAKSLVEVPSPFAGRVATLHGKEGEAVAVGSPLITIDTVGSEQAGSGNVLIGYGTTQTTGRGRQRKPRAAAAPDAVGPPAPQPTPPAGDPTKRRLVISPLVRRLARDGGVDLADVTATGEAGVITRSDVVRALAAREDPAPAAPPAVTPTTTPVSAASGSGERRTPLNGFRKAVAASLSRSRAEIPEATVWVDVDATALWQMRESTRTPADPGPGLLAYLARFVVAGLKQYPVLNARLDTERQEIVELDQIHLGLAVQSERGLVVPAVLNAETMTTARLDAAIRDLTSRAREGRATAEELSAGTFTLNNYGSFRVDGSAAIINHPQVAILGFGRILDRPWVVDGAIVPRKITQMSFVFDHRVCDGGTAAGFMRVVADAIEDPAAAIRNL
ncbi:dihydrolipoamide acetyltransferase family protein [Nocardioides astragali]|uniref:Dihydrolipoamide acetyltransferase component of pyruvate dehydrogenase complex n=1 Tax=Nocardioides astragali TaxID=1776736 RepID=A0ABW2N5N4_9ACTN|nr:dihydrolipoamide acetyltransferase family protein [Nocardioides astragali]